MPCKWSMIYTVPGLILAWIVWLATLPFALLHGWAAKAFSAD